MLNSLSGVVRRTRQHHAVEHATLHLLAARLPNRRFGGYSDPLGFTIVGEATTEELQHAVGDALLRLQAGERGLAIHPNCGTNLLAAGATVTAASMFGSAVVRGRLERFVMSLVLVLIALVAARPLGSRLQAYTTLPDVEDRVVTEIRTLQTGRVAVFRVTFD